MSKIQGKCLCGNIRYRSEAAPLMTVVCHCKSCQRTSGSAFSVVVGVPKDALVMEGAQPDTFHETADSGQAVSRRFCSKCGSAIFSEAQAAPGMAWIKAGTLDDTSWLQPQMNVWCDSAQPWVPISAGVPRHPKNPPLG